MSWREIASVPLLIVCALSVVFAVFLPIELAEQVKTNRARLAELKTVSYFIDNQLQKGRGLPSVEMLRHWAGLRGLVHASDVSTAPLACVGGFEPELDDRFVIGFWVGEWSECLASPSNRTTLEISVPALLRSGLWAVWLSFIAAAFGFGSLAWVLARKKGRLGS